MADKRFRPKSKEQDRFKIPEVSAPNPDSLTPKFCLSMMRGGGCLTCCTKDEQAAFADTLRRLSNLTWGQIRQAPRHGLGYEKITKIDFTLPPQVTEDVTMIAFRFFGKAAMLGYRNQDVLHILWLDRTFTAYDPLDFRERLILTKFRGGGKSRGNFSRSAKNAYSA